jgi:hypothetical protein
LRFIYIKKKCLIENNLLVKIKIDQDQVYLIFLGSDPKRCSDRFHTHTVRAAAEATFAPIPPRMEKIHSHNQLIIIISIILGGGAVPLFYYTTLPSSSATAGSAAEAAATKKSDKYALLSTNYNFIPIALETLGPICSKATVFLRELGRRLSVATGDPRETTLLFQRLSVALQRFNAVCIRGTFATADDVD